jgi:extradiol dioxygenase family protein
MRPFHLAFPVTDLAATRRFYVDLIGARVGREAERWIDFDLGGHQLSAHLVDALEAETATNAVDGDAVPTRHFGLILSPPEWQALAARLRAAGVRFVIEPHTRFAGAAGEQSTLFLRDPSGNALEFKSFADDRMIFSR